MRRGRRAVLSFAVVAAGALAAFFVAACGETKKDEPTSAERGRRVYLANCTACHNSDPGLPGAVGPALAGCQRELIEARVLRAEYPPGYTPKRPTRVMSAMPYLAGNIDDLAAYLMSVPPR